MNPSLRMNLVRSFALFIPAALALLTSCSTAPRTATIATQAGIAGSVHGGEQPIAGATLQLYAVSTAGDAQPSTPLFTTSVTTDAGGGFNFTGDYTCPSASALVYLLATGGNPGLGPGGNNPQLALMTALGPCGNLTPSTFISVNELTTIAAVYALAPYMAGPAAIGSGTSDASALAAAFSYAGELVSTATGYPPGSNGPVGYSVPTTQLNTIADILATCTNSAGGSSGDGSPCGTYIALTTPSGITPPTNAMTALLNLANHPTENTAALYDLVAPTAPYQPTDATQPPDFSLQLLAQTTLTLTPTLGYNPPSGDAQADTAVLTNTGTVAATLESFTLTGSGASEFTQANTCPATLAAGASCNIRVTFTPISNTTATASLNVSSNSALTPTVNTALTGNTYVSVLLVLPTSPLTFASTQVGSSSAPQTITLSNYGPSPAVLGSISFVGADPADFTQANTCPTTLQAGNGCTITITFAPLAAGPLTATLSIASNSASSPTTLAVSGTASGISSLAASPSSLTFPTTTLGKPSAALTVTLTNNGTGPANFGSATITGTNPSDFTDSTNCTATLAAGASCSYSVTFTPAGTGTRTATLSISSNDPASPLLIPLSGSGTSSPALTVSPASLTFFVTNQWQTVTVTNTTSAALTLYPISYDNNCGTTLPALLSCTVWIGNVSGPLTVTDSNSDSATVTLTSYVNGGQLLSFPSVAVGTEGGSEIFGGTYEETLQGYQIWGYSFSGHASNGMPASGSCSDRDGIPCMIDLSWYPSSPGYAYATVTTSENQNYLFEGIAYGGSDNFTLSPGVTDFGLVTLGSNATRTITVNNYSAVYVTFSAPPTLTTGTLNNGDFAASTTCTIVGTPLYPSQEPSCTITVRFTPTTSGLRQATMSYTDAHGVTQSVLIQGTGTATASHLTSSASSLTFPGTSPGLFAPTQTLTITNSGTLNANFGSLAIIGADPSDFSANNGCTQALAPAATCSILVTFSPAYLGTRTATLSIPSNDPASPLNIALSGTGTSPVGSLSASSPSITFPPSPVGTPATSQAVLITNNGPGAVTISSITLTGTNAADFSESSTTCASPLASGVSCSITLNFTPSVAATENASLVLTSNAANSPTSISLNGTGTP